MLQTGVEVEVVRSMGKLDVDLKEWMDMSTALEHGEETATNIYITNSGQVCFLGRSKP